MNTHSAHRRSRCWLFVWLSGFALHGVAGRAAEDDGNTPLHGAAYDRDEPTVRALLAAGAAVNATNTAGATPLLYAAGDARVVKLLLEYGADPRIAAKSGRNPLSAAVVQRDAAKVSRLLLEAGAEPKALGPQGDSMLADAIFGGNPTAIDLLVERGASVNPEGNAPPLPMAAWVGDQRAVDLLLAHGADINRRPGFAGHAANFALYGGQLDVAAELFRHGADPTALSIWGHGTPPIVWAAYNQSGDTRVARILVEKGVDVNSANEEGETALSFALKTGSDTELVAYLRSVGARELRTTARKPLPQREVPSDVAGIALAIRQRVPAAIEMMTKSSGAFLQNSFVREKSQCVSCHQQYLPAAAFDLARSRGLQVNNVELGRLLHAQMHMLSSAAESGRQMAEPVPDAPLSLGNAALALRALHYAPDATTDALVDYLMRVQRAEGWWLSFDHRPPLEDGPLVATAWAALAVRNYAAQRHAAEARESLARARRWLVQQQPRTLNESIFQLLGLAWTGEPRETLSGAVAGIVRQQQADGGWKQLPGRETDAWATGSTLYALHEAGGMTCDDPVYQRGVAFLLRTQYPDGSWLVRTRTWPFQPHFNGRFPHGKDQWISAAGTAWASMALLLTLEPTVTIASVPSGQELITAFSVHEAAVVKPAMSMAAAGGGTIDFQRDVQPILERSCTGCHGGEKPKGKFTLSSREALLKGGQSGDPAVSPGYGDDSPLLHYIADEVEDLEMPPLDRREKYPGLTPAEVEILRNWIDEGAIWPETKPAVTADPKVVAMAP
ncbi:MAG: ankyrin repeat domain-containing protein [Opitutus sp.]